MELAHAQLEQHEVNRLDVGCHLASQWCSLLDRLDEDLLFLLQAQTTRDVTAAAAAATTPVGPQHMSLTWISCHVMTTCEDVAWV